MTVRTLSPRNKIDYFYSNDWLQLKSLRLRFNWMNWTLVAQKTEFQHQGSSILIGIFGITSVWRSHANILQQIIFRRYIVHFGGGKFGIVEKKTWKYCKKFQICKEFFYNGLVYFLGFSYTVCFLREVGKFLQISRKVSRDEVLFLSRRKTSVSWEGEPTCQKNPTFRRKRARFFAMEN